jgi:hypothetical protein
MQDSAYQHFEGGLDERYQTSPTNHLATRNIV